MPVYNPGKYLYSAIASILTQSHENLELVIVDDGSNTETKNVLATFKDHRIKLITNKFNLGLIKSLNKGIANCSGTYVARMDADDVSLSDRLECQVAFMLSTDVDICGGYILNLSGGKQKGVVKYPLTDEEIKYTLIGKSAFAHPSVMIKRSVFDSVLYENYKSAEDYRLWCRMAVRGFKMANIDKVLLHYRLHSGQVTVENRLEQKKNTFLISRDYIANNRYRDMVSIHSYYNGEYMETLPQYYKIFKDIVDIGIYDNIAEHHIIELCRSIFRGISPMNLAVGTAYLCATRNLSKDIKGELFVFAQACFFLNYDSVVYGNILKKLKKY